MTKATHQTANDRQRSVGNPLAGLKPPEKHISYQKDRW